MTKAVIFLCGRSIEVERPTARERTNDRLIDGASDGRGRCAEFYSERGKRKKERKEEGNEESKSGKFNGSGDGGEAILFSILFSGISQRRERNAQIAM